ncbi:hypothetical protein BJ912DRAFT_1085339 [Pholiota molesta]|nr:hypothetical protein BJ912DRAFT_1085339 [Pholiota molesta]
MQDTVISSQPPLIHLPHASQLPNRLTAVWRCLFCLFNHQRLALPIAVPLPAPKASKSPSIPNIPPPSPIQPLDEESESSVETVQKESSKTKAAKAKGKATPSPKHQQRAMSEEVVEDGPLAGIHKSTLCSAHHSALQAQKALEASPPPGLGEPAQPILRGQIAMKDIPIQGFSMAYLHQISEPLGSLEEFSGVRMPACCSKCDSASFDTRLLH